MYRIPRKDISQYIIILKEEIRQQYSKNNRANSNDITRIIEYHPWISHCPVFMEPPYLEVAVPPSFSLLIPGPECFRCVCVNFGFRISNNFHRVFKSLDCKIRILNYGLITELNYITYTSSDSSERARTYENTSAQTLKISGYFLFDKILNHLEVLHDVAFSRDHRG